MRSLKGVVADTPWLDRLQRAVPPVVGCNAAKADPIAIERLRLQIVRVVVLAVRVSLPSLHHRIVHRNAVAVQNTKVDADTFTSSMRARDACYAMFLRG